MRFFAEQTGFEGTDSEWSDEYRMLCSSYNGQVPSISSALFEKLVDDETDDGCYCDTDELRTILSLAQTLRVPQPSHNTTSPDPTKAFPATGVGVRSRAELIATVFHVSCFSQSFCFGYPSVSSLSDRIALLDLVNLSHFVSQMVWYYSPCSSPPSFCLSLLSDKKKRERSRNHKTKAQTKQVNVNQKR